MIAGDPDAPLRFIPAGAGNATQADLAEGSATVHPRGRGERLVLLLNVQFGNGSSPRARGTHHYATHGVVPHRFIPAGAGNAYAVTAAEAGGSVHPRGRGERLGNGLGEPLEQRFIPAGAGNATPSRPRPRTGTVHPRGRGERGSYSELPPSGDGSSPRARGTRIRSSSQMEHSRFIPAGAGNAAWDKARLELAPVHPRGRGERWAKDGKTRQRDGSSPRARGTRRTHSARSPGGRFIPAGAGNAFKLRPRWRRLTVHPRGRGERLHRTVVASYHDGSSPRARGTQQLDVVVMVQFRFIPAGAGNAAIRPGPLLLVAVHPRGRGERWSATSWRTVACGSSPRARGTPHRGHTWRLHSTVHPRGRGERLRLIPDDRQRIGSSPRARGTLALIEVRVLDHRFIPAGAGNAPMRCARMTSSTVHPRGRGERRHINAPVAGLGGSSPRARGTPRADTLTSYWRRFIPAGAGNASSAATGSRSTTVHPRGRGERLDASGVGQVSAGSSPRARGTRPRLPKRPRHRRFIPAGAGNAQAGCRRHSPSPVHPRGRGERLSFLMKK